jgi:hypothetical protein
MKTDKFPFAIGGERFLAERTFGDEPAAYRCTAPTSPRGLGADATFEHISGGGETSWVSLGAGLEVGTVIVFCSANGKVPTPKREPIHNINRAAKKNRKSVRAQSFSTEQAGLTEATRNRRRSFLFHTLRAI